VSHLGAHSLRIERLSILVQKEPQMNADLRRSKKAADAIICIANRQDLREPGRIGNNHESNELHECCSILHPYSWHSYNSWFKFWFRPTAGLRPSASIRGSFPRRRAIVPLCRHGETWFRLYETIEPSILSPGPRRRLSITRHLPRSQPTNRAPIVASERVFFRQRQRKTRTGNDLRGGQKTRPDKTR
jgi:hypothetical protein